MRTTTWTIIGTLGVVLACKGNSSANSRAGADTTMSPPAPAASAERAPREPTRHHRAAGSADSAAGEVTTKSATIPSGTTLSLTSNQKICTNTNHAGDTFHAAVATPIVTNLGALPSGATVTLSVTQVKASDNVTQHGQLGVEVDSLNVGGANYPLDADISQVKTTKVRATSMGQEATKTGIGTAAGAILGAVIGHSAKTALIGAAAGTAAGAGTAYATTKYDFCIPQGGAITAKMTSDASVRAPSS